MIYLKLFEEIDFIEDFEDERYKEGDSFRCIKPTSSQVDIGDIYKLLKVYKKGSYDSYLLKNVTKSDKTMEITVNLSDWKIDDYFEKINEMSKPFDFQEDWEDEPTGYNKSLLKLIKKWNDEHDKFCIRVSEKYWPDLVDFLNHHDIRWVSNSNVDVEDVGFVNKYNFLFIGSRKLSGISVSKYYMSFVYDDEGGMNYVRSAYRQVYDFDNKRMINI